jgi:signal transduction histidine kinase
MRLLLALSALVIIYVDPSEPDRLVGLTYLALIGYTLYSIVIHVVSVRWSAILPLRGLHWIDLGWYLALIALSSGTNSIFFFFFFFAILVASFWWGFGPGLRVTITSAILFSIVGYVSAPYEPDFQLNRFLLRPIYLLVLGYLIAYWGGHEVKLKRRLQFLKDINKLSNPRFGIERTINRAMERLRSFYNADSCLLVLPRSDGDGYYLRRVDRGTKDGEASVLEIGEEVSRLLRSPSPQEAVIRPATQRTLIYDIVTGESSGRNGNSDLVANTLDAKSLLSVPVQYRREPIGRLYLTGKRLKFDQSDIEFIIQLIDQIIPVLDNIRLIDDLASNAGEQERHKIARDIHDSVIQPYIGLNLGLTAISQKLARGDHNVAQEVKKLSELVLNQITDLRQYIGGLKEGEEGHGNVLVPALRRFASTFAQATGIDVEITAPEDFRVNDRLATEIFHLVAEGLSNIRRHTNAQRAEAELIYQNGNLVLQIENENPDGPARASFQPRSLTERTEVLGGELTVFVDDRNRTIVNIKIPL